MCYLTYVCIDIQIEGVINIQEPGCADFSECAKIAAFLESFDACHMLSG